MFLVAQRQHDRADHGDQQHEAGDLEEIDVVGVENVAEGRRVGALAMSGIGWR